MVSLFVRATFVLSLILSTYSWSAEIEEISTSIDQRSARSAKLKEEVAALQKGLAGLARTDAESRTVRQQEPQACVASKVENEKGLGGIQPALEVLSDYDGKADKAHAAADGAGGGIIGILEVVEPDFTKALAK